MIKIIWILVPEENAKRHSHEIINTKKPLKQYLFGEKCSFCFLKKINYRHHLISRILDTRETKWGYSTLSVVTKR